jgi:hypothetical protein
MNLLNWWKMPRRAWIIILSELSVIVTLGIGLYSEYLNSPYFQSYVNSLAPIVIPILSVAFGVTSASVATFLYFGMRKVQQSGHADETPRRRLHRRGRKIHTGADHKSAKTVAANSGGVPKPRFVITGPGQVKDSNEKSTTEKKDK